MSFTERMAYALERDLSDEERHAKVGLRVTAITLGWAVIVPILIAYGVTGRQRETEVLSVAATLTLLLPFTAAVVATHGRRFGLGAAYVVLTLLMVLPAVWVAQLG
ncbi:MAG: hypothetical protein SYR96_31555 [Actinomycetota bacterium]|nr:hypothetical protein [Actinomycetota bacterium]